MTSAALSSFRLDIVSDTICPWCYVGKRRLAAALPILEAEGLTFDVAWRPFQLNPTMPREGLDRRAYRSAKFGSWEKSQALDAQVTEAGASAGLVFRHDLMAKTPNTVASHALIRLARETGDAPCRIASSKRSFPPTSLKALTSVAPQFWPTLRKGLESSARVLRRFSLSRQASMQ